MPGRCMFCEKSVPPLSCLSSVGKIQILKEDNAMRNVLKLFSVIFVSLALVFSLSACSLFGGEESQDTTVPEISEDMSDEEYEEALDNAPMYEEEAEDAQLTFKKVDESEFFGKWHADSGQAIYMYGNVDLDIKSGGKWSGNVAGEDLSGTWKADGNALRLESEYFNASLSFTDKNVLVMQEDREDDGEFINTVLIKK